MEPYFEELLKKLSALKKLEDSLEKLNQMEQEEKEEAQKLANSFLQEVEATHKNCYEGYSEEEKKADIKKRLD